MDKCFNCGAEFEGKFCTECGVPNPNYKEQISVPAPPPVQPRPQQYDQPLNYRAAAQSNVTSTTGWVGWLILCYFLPIFGAVIMYCCSRDRSVKNCSKAMLIVQGIGIVFGILMLFSMITDFFSRIPD